MVKKLIGEKIGVCITRSKPRDFYDIYFILRSRMAFKKAFEQDKKLKIKILEAIEQTKLNFKMELKEFLPIGQRMVIKNFPEVLIREIERNIAV